MLNILIADDHANVRDGMRQILLEQPDIGRIGDAATGPAALEACRAGGWDLLLLDVTLPGRSGVEVLRELRRNGPQLPIIMVSFYLDRDYINQCFKAGASGYIAKETLPEDIMPAVRAVLAGQPYISQAVQEAMNAEHGPDGR